MAEDDGPRCLIFRASSASGTTFFARALDDIYRPSACYHDFSQSTPSLAETALAAAAHRSIRARLQILVASRGIGSLLSSLASHLLPTFSVPVLGNAFALTGSLPTISFSKYPTPAVELLARSLSGRIWHPKRLLLIADNAQESVADLRDVLGGLHSAAYRKVKFILFFIDRNEAQISYSNWIRRIRSTGIELIESTFTGPHEHLVRSLAAKNSVYLETREIKRITNRSKNDIYRTVELVSNVAVGPACDAMEPLQNHVLMALQLARQPLRKSDLAILIAGSPLVYYAGEAALRAVIVRLVAAGVVETSITDDEDQLVFLAGTSSPQLRRLEREDAQRLAIANEMYEYFLRVSRISVRHSESATARLLYHLARLVDPPAVPVHAQKIVKVALQKGSLSLARQYIEQACDEEAQTLEDFYLRLAYFVSAQEYESAADLLLRKRQWAELKIFRILRAVIDNRLRCHRDSIAEIDQLLRGGVSLEERSLLISYKIAGLLHEGRHSEAVEIFREEAPILSSATNFAYFLRNGSAAFLWLDQPQYHEAEQALSTARAAFEGQRDWFGYYTTLSNLGTISAYRGQMKTALVQFKEAHDHLEIFGVHHLEEVGFNYAVALALNRNTEESAKRVDNMLSYFEPENFPRIKLLALGAMLRLLAGGVQEARAMMQHARDEVTHLDLSEAKVYVQLNSAVVEAAAGSTSLRVRQYLDGAERLAYDGLDNRAAEVAAKLLSGKVDRQEVLSLFSFDYHQYWSQNPFELLPAASLAA